MSDRDWGFPTALGIVLCIALAWGLGVWNGTYNEARRADYYESEAKPYSGPLPTDEFWRNRAGTSETYKAICAGPIDREQADLCQQWRSAEKANEIAGYSLVSLIFGLIGLIGVGLTVRYSVIASRAATEAAGAAVQANQIARADKRAWIGIEAFERPARVTIDEDGNVRFHVSLSVKNYGESPATRVGFFFEFTHRWGGYSEESVLAPYRNDPRLQFGAEVALPQKPIESIKHTIGYGREQILADKPPRFDPHMASVFLIAGVGYSVMGDPERKMTLKAYSVALPTFTYEHQVGEAPLLLYEKGNFLPDLMT